VWLKYWSLRLLVSQLEGATKRVEVSGQRKNIGKHFARWGKLLVAPPKNMGTNHTYMAGTWGWGWGVPQSNLISPPPLPTQVCPLFTPLEVACLACISTIFKLATKWYAKLHGAGGKYFPCSGKFSHMKRRWRGHAATSTLSGAQVGGSKSSYVGL